MVPNKKLLKSKVFNSLLNIVIESALRITSGSAFHSLTRLKKEVVITTTIM